MNSSIISFWASLASLGWQLLTILAGPAVLAWMAWRVRNIATPWVIWTAVVAVCIWPMAHLPVLLLHPVVRMFTHWDPGTAFAMQVMPFCTIVGSVGWVLFLSSLVGLTNAFCRCRHELDVQRMMQTR